ncbi:thiamine phosphate synthase [Echinicola sp. CAU 1574]|uniref:Thiamine phosphate synthase n=1 Tax=Echinicola arenosa TaxID=2774144 RepID=A0ABR9AKD9_9BACT|nr:thiamine phosphate synthase [Echinicola arenosa]MBD8489241.1 thiamine phosphate synthase [Echinicola arenosa]
MMEFILITDPGQVNEEVKSLIQFMDQGLTKLHIRKPEWPPEQIKKLIKDIPSQYHQQISLHGNVSLAEELGIGYCHFKSHQNIVNTHLRISKSFHYLDDLLDPQNNKLDYGFFSPVYDSVSKQNYRPLLSQEEITSWLKLNKLSFSLIALGGILPSKVLEVKIMGFDGVAVLGSIWKHHSTKDRFNEFLNFQKEINDVQ